MFNSLFTCDRKIEKGKKCIHILETFKPNSEQPCTSQEQNKVWKFGKVWKIYVDNTVTCKVKPSVFSLNLCKPNRLGQITVLEATKMKQKSSMTD